MNLQDFYNSRVKPLPTAERLRLAKMILNEIPPQANPQELGMVVSRTRQLWPGVSIVAWRLLLLNLWSRRYLQPSRLGVSC